MEEKENQNIENESQNNTHDFVKQENQESKKEKTLDNQATTPFGKSTKNKSKILLVVLATIGILIIFYLVFYFKTTNSKQVLVNSLDLWTDSLEILEKPMRGMKQLNWEEMTTTGTGTIQLGDLFMNEAVMEDEATSSFMKKLNTLSLKADVRISQKQKKAFVNLFSDMENERLFDIVYANQNQKQYILFKGVFEKYLQLEQTQDLFNDEIDKEKLNEDIEYVWNVLKESLKKNIKTSYIKKENETITVDGKTIDTTKFSLIFDEQVGAELIANIVKDLKADERANTFITSFYEDFDSYEPTEFIEYPVIGYSVNITKGLHKIVKASFIMGDNDSFNIESGKENVISIVEDGNLLMTASIKEEDDGFTVTCKTTEEDSMEIVITGKKDGENIVYNLSSKVDGSSVVANLTLNQKEIKKDEAYKEVAELSITVKTGGIEVPVATLKFDFDTTKGAEFEDIKDSILITELSEEDQNKITTYFENMAQKFIQ